MKLPLAWALAGASQDELINSPILAFLVRHHANSDAFMFDLGLRKDMENHTPAFAKQAVNSPFAPNVPFDVVEYAESPVELSVSLPKHF